MESIWQSTVEMRHFKRLQGDVSTDVLIIGGGMAGILTAYFLEQKGVDYILVEADRICSGITKNTTAKITSQHGLIYNKLINEVGKNRAKLYLDANQEALSKYRRLCSVIDCNFEKRDNYIYSVKHKRKLSDEINALRSLDFEVEFAEPISLPFKTVGAVKFTNQAQFNPLKFINGIVQGLNIYERTNVRKVEKHKAYTDYGVITSKKTIVATHFPFINTHGSYFMKLYQDRSYVIALRNGAILDGMYMDENKHGVSLRNYDDCLLIGGGSHRTGKCGGGWDELRDFAKLYYPGKKEVYHWSTQDCMTLDDMPYIGQYSKQTKDLYVATGFNKWGMTSSMVAALMLTDMIFGTKNPYEEVFSPSRNMIRPQLFYNGFEATANLLRPTTPRCSHLGCALKWNDREHSWDCTCHGSRFDRKGHIIDNPATKDIRP